MTSFTNGLASCGVNKHRSVLWHVLFLYLGDEVCTCTLAFGGGGGPNWGKISKTARANVDKDEDSHFSLVSETSHLLALCSGIEEGSSITYATGLDIHINPIFVDLQFSSA
ncbi:hypothetical protein ACJX0J_009461 [Zea mays]